MANNERQAYGEINEDIEARKSEGWKNADGSSMEVDLNMISGEGLTPGYEGFSQSIDDSVESVEDAKKRQEGEDSKVKMLEKLTTEFLDAQISGDPTEIKKSEAVLNMFKERNNID